MVAAAIGAMVTFSVASISIMVGRLHKSVFAQQHALHQATKAIEALNREIRAASAPLLVFDDEGKPALQGNRVDFVRLNGAITRRITLISADGDMATPWDNSLIFDPDIDRPGDEIVIAKGIAPTDPAGAFIYGGAQTPLTVRMRTGDPIVTGDDEASVALREKANTMTGPGLQGVEINITVAPRN